MLIDFFLHLKTKKLPVSTREFLTLLEALKEHVAENSIDDFYFLSRTCLVKDETHYDKFDRAFGEYFKGVTQIPGLEADIPEEWLKMMMKKHLTPEEIEVVDGIPGDVFLQRLQQREELACGHRQLFRLEVEEEVDQHGKSALAVRRFTRLSGCGGP